LGLLKDSFRQDIISLYKKLKLPYRFEFNEKLCSEKPTVNSEKLSGKSGETQEKQNGKPSGELEKKSSATAEDIETLKVKLADDVFNAMKFDKKFSASTNKFVLLKGMNRPVFYHNVEAKVIKEAILKNISIKL
jgi:3-dehydroquinate synthetase